MKPVSLIRFAAIAALVLGVAACEDSKTTTAPGALAQVRFNAPDTAQSGQNFEVDVNAVNVGVNGIHNGQVTVTVPAPLTIVSVDSSAGTSASASGNTVTWMLNTLDSNSQSTLHIHLVGTLPPASPGISLTLSAMLTADGIRAGDAVATASVQLMP